MASDELKNTPDKIPAPGLSAKVDKKRKRQAEETPKQDKSATTTPKDKSTEGLNKKKQRKGKNNSQQKGKDGKQNQKGKGKPKQKENTKPEPEPKRDESNHAIDESIAMMDGRLLADHFAQKLRKVNKEITAVELNDLCVSDSVFLDTTSFNSPRTLDQLPAFLKAFVPDSGSGLSSSSEEKGTPHTLVISPAALRAADVVRALRMFQNKESIIGKLFAKHIKLEEAKQFLERARTGIGVGTPTRLSDLIESGTLKLGELERIIIDGSYIDQKQRGIFDMKETHLPLLQLLTRSELRGCYERGTKPSRILVF